MARKSSENLALKFLLSVASLRTAPKTMEEIRLASNRTTGNVCYINPEDYAAVPGIRFPHFRRKALPVVQVEGLVPGEVVAADHPSDLERIVDTVEGIHMVEPCSLIVCASLMPKGGVIYGPLNQSVLDWFEDDLHVDDFPDFNHTRSGGLIINAKPAPREIPSFRRLPADESWG